MQKFTTREDWLVAAVAAMKPLYEVKGLTIPEKLKVCAGWPSSKGTGTKSRALGECWLSDHTDDGTIHVFISPLLDATDTDNGVLPTLAHELIHACLNGPAKNPHGPKFKKHAEGLGLEGKPTHTHAGAELKEACGQWLAALGDYPHSKINLLAKEAKKQTTRMIKCECEECGYVARTTKKWLVEAGAPLCPKHSTKPMAYEPLDDEEEGGESE